jgi:hypothetical protein
MTIEALEKKIQKLLLDFADEHGHRIEAVNVDTRNYANYAVDIILQ